MAAKDKASAAQVSDTVRTRPRSAQPESEAARTNGVRHRRCLSPAPATDCRVDGCPEVGTSRVCPEHQEPRVSGLWWPVRRRDGEVVLIDRRGVPVGRLRPEAARFVASQSRAPP
jgi:hypothetical protein